MAAYDEPQHDPVSRPPDIAVLPEAEAIHSVKDWFLQNFEDPVHSTPYESAEGGYQYIWGGPYEAREILETFFDGALSAELINGIADELESESLEWVPNSGRRQPPEEWLDRSIPDDPHSIYLDSYHHAGDVLADSGSNDGSHLINRLIFAHHVTALEAYLGDSLYKAVMKDQDAMKRLVVGNRDMTSQRYTIADVLSNSNFVSDKVTELDFGQF